LQGWGRASGELTDGRHHGIDACERDRGFVQRGDDVVVRWPRARCGARSSGCTDRRRDLLRCRVEDPLEKARGIEKMGHVFEHGLKA
jgi:hypothetical protein